MSEFTSIFQFRKRNDEKLRAFGFRDRGRFYEWERPILENQFLFSVSIEKEGAVDYTVRDLASGELYTLVKVPKAQGPFVGQVRECCKQLLTEIAERCFDREVFRAPQTKRVVQLLEEKYGALPEYLWESHPNYAVFRHRENKKWFAVLLTVDRGKLDPALHGEVEILDLKAAAQTVSLLTETGRYYPGYHMNKNYWYTAVLDDTLSDEELLERLSESFQLTG